MKKLSQERSGQRGVTASGSFQAKKTPDFYGEGEVPGFKF
ncbi:hypothetical protein PG5_31860 [Pseudomonas sp. G5(2012)]|nr:hypothetical protein PG5_31860 [Pseudomonas sp. G5(2012)]